MSAYMDEERHLLPGLATAAYTDVQTYLGCPFQGIVAIEPEKGNPLLSALEVEVFAVDGNSSARVAAGRDSSERRRRSGSRLRS